MRAIFDEYSSEATKTLMQLHISSILVSKSGREHDIILKA